LAAVLVHIDLDGDRPHASSLAALAAGRSVASSWGATLYAALIAHGPTDASADAAQLPGMAAIETELARAGADKIVVAITDAPIAPLWASVGKAWQGVLDHLRPRLVLFGADGPSAPELGPRTGARIGARLLVRAHAHGIDDVELRDRDGGYMRATDSGAAVALIGRAAAAPPADDDVDLVVLALPGSEDPRVELAGSTPADLAHTASAAVVVGADAAKDARIVGDARRLAELLGGNVFTGEAPPLAPELCVAVGSTRLELAGAASLVQIGTAGGRHVDAALAGAAGLVERLEGS
jgi:hypothetical protein